MKKVKVNLYKFEELSDEAQKKALENSSDINVDYYWSEPTEWNFKDELEALGYENIELSWNGFGSQGDGASFTAIVDIAKWCRVHKKEREYKSVISDFQEGIVSIVLRRIDRMYAHENTVNTEYEGEFAEGSKLFELIDEIEAERVIKSKEFYGSLEEEYCIRVRDDVVKETLVENDYEFLASGNLPNFSHE